MNLIGKYKPLKTKLGNHLTCELRGEVEVAGFTESLIPWPYCHPEGGNGAVGCVRSLIVCGDLARAVRDESRQAVAHWWGVSPETVKRWRKALGVGRMNAGTAALWSDMANEKFTAEDRRRGGRLSRKRPKDPDAPDTTETSHTFIGHCPSSF